MDTRDALSAMNCPKETVIRIFYQDKYKKLHIEAQGKFYSLEGKPTYLADMNPAKWWRNYAGYSIAKQVLDAFSKLKIRPQIIYRVKETATLYFTTPTQFIKKGIFVAYGSHEQFVLPVRYFKARQGNVSYEPMDLPLINISDWIKSSTVLVEQQGILDERQEFYKNWSYL